MSSTKAVARTLLHTRSIECAGYKREDGLWDIEGRILDVKAHDFPLNNGSVAPRGAHLHEMRVTMTLDDELVIRAIRVDYDNAPYAECRECAPAYGQLVGLKVKPGFGAQAGPLIRGRNGCTHVTDLLLGPMATTTFQAISGYRHASNPELQTLEARRKGFTVFADTCHALRKDGALARSLGSQSEDA
jgi:hypothetical protein